MAINLFNPIMGTEERVLSSDLSAGSVYFTTDTRKIYLDIDENHSKLPMGGNIGLFYGNMKLTSPPVEGQTEFEFNITDIVGNESGVDMLKPNNNDLILNSDGCFYKVLSSYGDDMNIVLTTEKLTIAGTGGGGGGTGGGGESGSLAGMTMSRLRFDNGNTILYQSACPVSFAVKITDDLGDPLTGNIGTYDLYINSVKKESGTVIGSTVENVTDIGNVPLKELNTIDVGPYLALGENINVKISVNGINGGVITRAGSVSTTNMVLTWNYDETTVNIWDQSKTSMDLEWSVSGNLEKTTHIIINDDYSNPITVVDTQNNLSIPLNFVERNLWHGAHKIEMYATAEISGGIARTPSIYKNIIIAKHDDSSAIISCGLFDSELTQYNTVQIPIIIYDPTNTGGNAQVKLIENGEERDVWTDIENSKVYYWSYTPIISGTIVLTIQCNGAEKSLTLSVKSINIDINEKSNYAFRFKASEFASNTNVQKWNSNGYSAQFSEKFDWYNGGLKTELDENKSARQFLCIKAGSTMSINYPLFESDARTKGKCLKVIFKATKCKDYDGQVLKCYDGNTGLIMRAQNASFYFAGKTLEVPYCEDEYIEFELDITPNLNTSGYKQRYVRPWLDGVPAGVQIYDANDNFAADENTFITIGSNDCDVYLYMIKMYETHLTDSEHLDNFIADAPNATEMISRFNRNDILDESGEISYTKLAEKNPNCRVHLYEMDRMTMHKKDPVENCLYTQYKGSKDAILNAEGVKVKVQGTSSAAYGLAAFNLDSDFKEGFTDLVKNEHIDKWSMSPTAIPVDYFCTKVNVASAEGTNNALNQEWYNRFQPYQTVIRGRKKGEYNTARDCMEFTPGIVFIKDNNPETNDEQYGGKGDNVFKNTPGYCDTVGDNGLLTSSYYKMYSIGCMGNSKDNIEVFHDLDNPYECCVENGDNQLPGQWMTDVQGGYSVDDTFYPVSITSISSEDKTLCPDGIERDNRTLWETAMDEIYGFRYPDGIDEVKELDSKYAESMIQGWYDFVYWMSHSNPQPAYERVFFNDGYYLVIYNNEEEFNADERDRYILNDSGDYVLTSTFIKGKEYYLLLSAADGFAARTYDVYRWADTDHSDYILVPEDEILNANHKDTSDSTEINAYFKKTDHIFGATNKKLEAPVTYKEYKFRGYKAPDIINGEELGLSKYQADYTPVLKNTTISTYANTYTHDTYEYRMAKMLSECEDHLCMDSIVYHYLFIERHSMVDNVAKNTFWSTEDGKVWNLTKNYDNDTSDGNDNQGKLSLTYGFEPGDTDNKGVSIFNAGNSVWMAFIKGIYSACQIMYTHLDNLGAWSPKDYLKEHTKWQSAIPERCWIEDYYRKYLRPYEVYGDQMFLGMHEGGQKKHQRNQYETYQNYYISSKYFGTTCKANNFVIRAEGSDITKISLPVQLYADCYIRGAYGSGTDNPNLSMRCKRNEDILINSPITNATDATIYLWPSNLYQQLGDAATGLNDYGLTQFTSTNARKLRTLSLGVYSGSENETLKDITFAGNENLENVYVARYKVAESLDLKDSPGLLQVDARGSGFKSVVLPENAPTTSVQLHEPVTLTVSDLTELETFTFANYNKLNTIIIEDIDRSPGINTKDIVDKANNLQRYRLRDVIWTIKNSSEINTTNNTISILEKLLSLKPAADTTGQTIPQQDSLTGKLTITQAAFSGSDEKALQIYETYAKAKEGYTKVLYKDMDNFLQDTRIKYYLNEDGEYVEATTYDPSTTYYVIGLTAAYPNLDISFENNNLYNVNIYDGDGNVKWMRKTINGGKVNADFLKYGPDGSFTSSSVQKTSTAEWEYVFLNQWIIKNDAGQQIGTLSTAEPIYNTAITGNIHMHPQFETKKRSYAVSVKMKDPNDNSITTLNEGIYEYGTTLDQIIPQDIIPYVSSESLDLLEVYDFKGYSLVEGSSTLVSSKYTVTGAATLWAVFKLENDIRKITHPEWFTGVKWTYNFEKDATNFGEKVGVRIRPKYSNLRGKITIPSTFELDGEKLPVISITGFSKEGNLPNNNSVTHIFMQDNNQLYNIDAYTFYRIMSLVYFDFEKCAVRQIGESAFQYTSNLITSNFGYQLYYVDQYAFNQGLKTNNITTIILPPTLVRVGNHSFSNLKIAPDCTLQIGSPKELSQLDLSKAYQTSFSLSNNGYKTINFYTSKYQSADSTCQGELTVAQMFVGALSTAEDASLYVGTGA